MDNRSTGKLKKDVLEKDAVKILHSIPFTEESLQRVLLLETKGHILTQSQRAGGSIFFRIWDLKPQEQPHCLSTTELAVPTTPRIIQHYLPEGPALLGKYRCILQPRFEFLFRLVTQLEPFYPQFKNPLDKDLRVFMISLLGPDEAAFLARAKVVNEPNEFFVYKKKEKSFEPSPVSGVTLDPTALCFDVGTLYVGRDNALDVMTRQRDGSFALVRSILFQGKVYKTASCSYSIKNIQVLSAEEVLCLVACHHFGKQAIDLLIKVNVRNGSMRSVALPCSGVQSCWGLPVQFLKCPSLFIVTQVGKEMDRPHLFDANTLCLQPLAIPKNLSLQAILPDFNLVMANEEGVTVFEVQKIKDYMNFLDSQIRTSFEGSGLTVRVLVEDVEAYLNRDILTGACFASFFKEKNVAEKVSASEEKSTKVALPPINQPTTEKPLDCRVM